MPGSRVCRRIHESLALSFPKNPFIERLLAKAEELSIHFEPSPVHEQWLYQPDRRAILVWEPDLASQSLSYLVVILAHELGHAIDFDRDPSRRSAVRGLHWLDVPDEVEIAAFVEGFLLLKELRIPISLSQYEMMIAEPLAGLVREEIEQNHLCCLLSRGGMPAAGDGAAS